MARQCALRAEVLLCLDDADAEELRPKAVDRDARSEGIVAAHQPLREAEPVRWRALRKRVKRGGYPGLHLLAGIKKVAFVQQMRFTALVGGKFAHHWQDHRLDVVEFLPQLLQAPVDFDQRRGELAEIIGQGFALLFRALG